MMLRRLAAALLLAASVPALAANTRVDHGLVLDDVTVVDTGTGQLTPGRAVVAADGHIVRIAPAGSVTVTGTAQWIEVRGKFVVPGYLDIHAHPLKGPGGGLKLDLMLATASPVTAR